MTPSAPPRREFGGVGKQRTETSGWSRVTLEWERLRDMQESVTREAFKAWLRDDEFRELLDEADIEITNHSELFDVLDADMGGELSMDELTTGLMKLRGPVTKADIVAVRLKVSHLTRILENVLPTLAEPSMGHRSARWDRTV
mmetsp:Transcript_12325/g.38499  ORF Transcript_12325/g.38499 Transcript_12325/m.38499 type:complete len:143 (-) Transcript_12325:111-539(-)